MGGQTASHSYVPRVSGTSVSNSGAPLLKVTAMWQVPMLSSEMKYWSPFDGEALEQAPVAVTDLTSPIRSAGTETTNTPAGQLHTIGVLPLELHAAIMSKGPNALNRFMPQTLSPLSTKSTGRIYSYATCRPTPHRISKALESCSARVGAPGATGGCVCVFIEGATQSRFRYLAHSADKSSSNESNGSTLTVAFARHVPSKRYAVPSSLKASSV